MMPLDSEVLRDWRPRQADRKRAAAEDVERSQGMHLLMNRVVECTTVTEEEANAQYLRER